jgi:group I intron endonuclease
MLTSPSGKSYIGQTIGSFEKRFRAHQWSSSKCMAIYNAIQKYGWENFEKDWYECPDEDLNFDEELLIREMKTLAPNGYNLKEGGANGKPSEETKRKMKEAQLGDKSHFYGKKHTKESKEKMSEEKRGDKNHMFGKTGERHPRFRKKSTEKTKEKLSEAKKGDNNPTSKKVYQYTLDGTYIRSFSSGGEAGRYLNKKKDSKISACARGDHQRKSAHGFKWSYTKI